MTIKEHNNLHHKGKIISEKTRQLMSENNSGENHSMSILTEKDVIQILKYLDEGILTQKEIAKMFNVTQSNISCIKNNKLWKHIKRN